MAVSLIVVALAACGSAAPSTPAASPPAPSGSVATTPEPSGAATAPTACYSLNAADCQRAAEAALASLDPGGPAAIYLSVGPFGCATGERCPTSLVARPEGDVLVEYAGVPAVTVHLKLGADGKLAAAPAETFGIVVPPSSPPDTAPGPFPFSLGHCGLYSGIDVAGHWWDPIGPIDAEHGDAVNAAEGTFAFLDPTHATFQSSGGFAVTLLRRDGPKHLPFCD